jgi:hypothetical protein
MAMVQIRNRIVSGQHNKLSGPAYNVMHVEVSDPTAGNVQAAIADISTFYGSFNAYLRSGTVITIGERVLNVSTTPAGVIPVTPATQSGATGTASLPPEVAAVVSWRSGLAGARYRGRTYLGPLAVAALATGGEFVTGFVTALQGAASTLVTALAANTPTTPLVVFSRKFNTWVPVTSAFVDDEPDSQRRRGG